MVLHSLDKRNWDAAELWLTCRGICRCFKWEVEEFFTADYLPVSQHDLQPRLQPKIEGQFP